MTGLSLAAYCVRYPQADNSTPHFKFCKESGIQMLE